MWDMRHTKLLNKVSLNPQTIAFQGFRFGEKKFLSLSTWRYFIAYNLMAVKFCPSNNEWKI